jgi:hypothetical protein
MSAPVPGHTAVRTARTTARFGTRIGTGLIAGAVVAALLPWSGAEAVVDTGGGGGGTAGATSSIVPVEPLCGDVVVPAGDAVCLSAVTAPVRPAAIAPRVASARTSGWTPTDIAAMYGLPPVPDPVPVGTGPTVAVVVAGGQPTLAADLDSYRSAYGLGTCDAANGCLTVINDQGSTASASLPAPVEGWDFEIAMDTEAVSASCPACRILVAEAPSTDSTDLDQAIQAAVTAGADYVSMSYGVPDTSYSTRRRPATESILSAHPDVTFVAASGDAGWASTAGTQTCGGGTTACADYPATSSHVVAAGGTTETESGRGATATWTPALWAGEAGSTDANEGGSSSGCSGWAAMPTGQALVAGAVAACLTHRASTDLSALADGFVVYHPMAASDGSTYSEWLGGGTSLASPLIAGMYARAGNHTSPFDFYTHALADPSIFDDVSGGSTRGCTTSTDITHLCTAAAGWDGPTGLGVPTGLSALAAYAPRVGGATAGAAPSSGTAGATASTPAGSTPSPTASSTAALGGSGGSGGSGGGSLPTAGTSAGSSPASALPPTLPTSAATSASTTAPTSLPSSVAPTTAPTTAPIPAPTAAPTHAPATTAPRRLVLVGGLRLRGTTAPGRTLTVSHGVFRSGSVNGPTVHPRVTLTWSVGGRTVHTGRTLRIATRWHGKRIRLVLRASEKGYRTTVLRLLTARVHG